MSYKRLMYEQMTYEGHAKYNRFVRWCHANDIELNQYQYDLVFVWAKHDIIVKEVNSFGRGTTY